MSRPRPATAHQRQVHEAQQLQRRGAVHPRRLVELTRQLSDACFRTQMQYGDAIVTIARISAHWLFRSP
jgi:hypothetical protein